MQSLKGKKLLILGGPALACDIVEKAREMGVYTIVTDWYEPDKSPAKLIADEYAMISTADLEALKNFVKEKSIDGVFTSFIDSTLPYIQVLCDKLNLPFYATKEQIENTLDKAKFKALCKAYDIPVVEEYKINHLKKSDFPLVVKPTDSSGSKGITICFTEDEFESAYTKAIQFSKTKNVILEKYMDNKRPNINLDYVFIKDKAYLSAVGDLYSFACNENITPITSAVFYPSQNTYHYVKTLDSKVRKMFEEKGFKNGFLYIQSFYDDEGYHFYETGYRLGGGQSYRLIEKINGVNHLEMLIQFALTGEMCDEKTINNINPFFNKSACGLSIILKEGKITSIEGLDLLKKNSTIVNFRQNLPIGFVVKKEFLGTVQQLFAKVHIVDKDRNSIEDTIEFIFKTLKVLDEKGENMVLHSYCNERRGAI
jgi:biotin carboxylase